MQTQFERLFAEPSCGFFTEMCKYLTLQDWSRLQRCNWHFRTLLNFKRPDRQRLLLINNITPEAFERLFDPTLLSSGSMDIIQILVMHNYMEIKTPVPTGRRLVRFKSSFIEKAADRFNIVLMRFLVPGVEKFLLHDVMVLLEDIALDKRNADLLQAVYDLDSLSFHHCIPEHSSRFLDACRAGQLRLIQVMLDCRCRSLHPANFTQLLYRGLFDACIHNQKSVVNWITNNTVVRQLWCLDDTRRFLKRLETTIMPCSRSKFEVRKLIESICN